MRFIVLILLLMPFIHSQGIEPPPGDALLRDDSDDGASGDDGSDYEEADYEDE